MTNLSYAWIGLTSALAVGPAGFTLIQESIHSNKWPVKGVLGFFLGDVIYIIAALWLLQTPILHIPWVTTFLMGLTALVFFVFGVRLVFPGKTQSISVVPAEFGPILLLTLSNVHLLLIYSGLFLPVMESPHRLNASAANYLGGFFVGFILLLGGSLYFNKEVKKWILPLQYFVGFSFLVFGMYLLGESL